MSLFAIPVAVNNNWIVYGTMLSPFTRRHVAVWACVVLWAGLTTASTPNMIVILLDGVRWDYLSVHKVDEFPGFGKFTSSGVTAEYLNPVYPPNSFPNWHTIVTGLYPESHGIVGNFMYDRERESVFSLDRLDTTSDPDWWRESEPLYTTSTKQGLDTALFVWSRCDVPWEGSVVPRYCQPYEDLPANTQLFVKHLTQAVAMIQQEGYALAMVYEGLVDTQGHAYGPDSPEVTMAMRDVDLALLGLWEELHTRGMLNTTNVVVLSDHGMTNTHSMTWLDLGPCLDPRTVVKTTEHSGYLNVLPVAGYVQEVVESIATCPGVGEHVEVIRKADMEDRYHYKAHPRILDVMVIPREGFFMKTPGTNYSEPEREGNSRGNHGFDHTQDAPPPQARDMRGILFASGPSFAAGQVSGPMEQVDVYPLLCRALHLPCHAHNGSTERIDAFFAPPMTSSAPEYARLTSIAVNVLTVVGALAAGFLGMVNRNQL